ncbi:cleavage stimulation factor subunit 2 tau variant isoform X2 [Hyalella azteca]|uniref:Cleavage stimulation factor subunit 2 tau variant isoform X2 n=1 Tax=Hyalella azteca TaxID=294128 RepID=A0A8B7PEE5_HYAAZ|nr:cleavage stimulation factor subunit 2 tau variant isoform X2 [Hyalella azteca]
MSETSVVVEKSLRSVFVGNIPYEATEEKLKDIFNQVGPVVSFKLMHDRESGKPRGYGFCEYKDQETALSAMRNLNGFEIGGRPLRVDNACTEKSRMEMQSLMMGPVVESPYGPDVEPSQAPEAISNAVASLPPEQMFELMRQMQVCVRSNRSEARTMLLNNPQLAYALLQAQVVMRIIDPKTAVQLLHGEVGSTTVNPKKEPGHSNGVGKGSSASSNGLPPSGSGSSRYGGPNMHPSGPSMQGAPGGPSHIPGLQGPPPAAAPHLSGPPHMPPGPPHHLGPQGMQGPPGGGPPPYGGGGGGDFDLRGPPPRGSDQDMRMAGPPRGPPMDFPPQHHGDFDSRFGRDGRGGDMDQREPRYRDQPPFPRDGRDARMDQRDPRGRDEPRGSGDRDFRAPLDSARDPRSRGGPPPADDFPRGPPSGGSGLPASLTSGLAGHDQEKASLIMQVLQLSDEQIRMLPPEQQSSILQLKEQIQQSQH